MFKKKECKKCGNKISDKYDFCPYCGNSLGTEFKEEDWGMLGKNDFTPLRDEIKIPAGLNMIFNSLMKNLDKQLKEVNKNSGMDMKKPMIKKGGISINISTSGNRPPEIRVNKFGNSPNFKQEQQTKKQIKEIPTASFSQENLKKFSSLPKQEPTTNIRRLSNKVVYEIKMPGVKSTKDVSITKLESSIEIKAIAKDKAYFKIIPINLPIVDYHVAGGKLILELGAGD